MECIGPGFKPRDQPQETSQSLPTHLHDLVNQTSRDLDVGQQHRLAAILLQYTDLFPAPGSTLTEHTDAVEHEIDTGHTPPIRCTPRRMAPSKMKKEEECVADKLTCGQIETSDGPWSSPVVLVTKKDGGTRFCVDYRRLNDITVKDTYPLPWIDDTLDMLSGKQWFSTLDLASGYWQVSLSQDARAKTAFATHCLVYLDDIISFRSTFDDALASLTLIFERLRSYGLQLKSTKCHLFRSSVPFLGHIVGRQDWSVIRQRSRT